eukprot:CAMPEP_0113874570 /NCGR_PEP_ID=MMETSP0780_2-20120614/4413_1 /TAXON_ID=652834 /ORGANISM="Palpitomonas bilix" /LENGTH=56 /DNA_ID=CAMNT_0000860369 /DNA_START=36 /DNA_END=206 /DNA_ORIENTATION=+ /assembly_acc=CAM_ASM_000599
MSAIYNLLFKNNSAYVAYCIAGAVAGAYAIDNAGDMLWNSMNRGRFFKDIKIADDE